MKCNAKELALLSEGDCEIEGRLNYCCKKTSNGTYYSQSVFKERWFKLKKNYLFYFKILDLGKIDMKNPAGVFVLENSAIKIENGENISFAFSLSFLDDPEKKHIFSARSEDNANKWVVLLRMASYEYLRSQLYKLQSKIFSISGKDPLLMVPRNEGAKLWAPAAPFSTEAACVSTCYGGGFQCHLHNNNITLARSKSAFHVHHSREETVKVTVSDKQHPIVRSKTTALAVTGRQNPFNSDIFDNQPVYTRTAPSPPVRKKHSPRMNRQELNLSDTSFADRSKLLGTTSILQALPVVPRRKISPKPSSNIGQDEADALTNGNSVNKSVESNDSDDLIKF